MKLRALRAKRKAAYRAAYRQARAALDRVRKAASSELAAYEVALRRLEHATERLAYIDEIHRMAGDDATRLPGKLGEAFDTEREWLDLNFALE